MLRDILIPDGSGGQLHIDFLLLTGRGLLVVDYRDVEGVVFGGEHMREWAVMNGSERSTFLNPLEALYDRIAAVRCWRARCRSTAASSSPAARSFRKGGRRG